MSLLLVLFTNVYHQVKSGYQKPGHCSKNVEVCRAWMMYVQVLDVWCNNLQYAQCPVRIITAGQRTKPRKLWKIEIPSKIQPFCICQVIKIMNNFPLPPDILKYIYAAIYLTQLLTSGKIFSFLCFQLKRF